MPSRIACRTASSLSRGISRTPASPRGDAMWIKDDQRNIARPPSSAHTTTRFVMGTPLAGAYGPTRRGVNGTAPRGSLALRVSLQEVVDRHRPTGKDGLGLRALAETVDAWLGRLLRGVHPHPPLAKDVHVPHDACARREVVGSLGRHLLLRGGAVIFLASHLGREDRSALQELPPGRLADVESGIGAEGPPIRKVDDEAHVVGDGVASAGLFLVFPQA